MATWFELFLTVWGLMHALDDPVVIVGCAAVGGGAAAFARRLDGAPWSSGCLWVIGNASIGAVLTAITSAAAAFVGMELFPRYPKLVIGAILFTTGVVDMTTDAGRSWVQREMFGRLLALFDAARNGGRYVPPSNTPTGAPSASPVVPPDGSPVAGSSDESERSRTEPGKATPTNKGPW